MDIVILDGFAENPGDLSWDGFRRFGDLTVHDRTPADDGEEIIRRIGTAEIIITNKTPLTAATFAACPTIRYVGLLSTGYNIADIAEARRRGIPVCNVPSYGSAAVGQHTMALLLELTNRVGHHDHAVHCGRWAASKDFCFWDYPLVELEGMVFGAVGFGRIGQAAARAARGMGMRVLATGSRPTPEGRALAEYVSLNELYAIADVVSLHCPLLPDTAGMINRDSIAKMKDGVIILNTARGSLVVERDLAEALNSGKVYGAGLDVVSDEPMDLGNPLLTARNCIITPHIAWASRAARLRLMDVAVANLRAFLVGTPQNVVNS